MVAENTTVVAGSETLTYSEACRIAQCARKRRAHTVLIDLSRTQEAETSAFARLVLLRRDLLHDGRDLRLIGLHDRARRLYEINRLGEILPGLTDRQVIEPAKSDVAR